MSELSHAAQSIEDAYFNADGFGYRSALAAALRVAARALCDAYASEEYFGTADEFLDSIATELEAQ